MKRISANEISGLVKTERGFKILNGLASLGCNWTYGDTNQETGKMYLAPSISTSNGGGIYRSLGSAYGKTADEILEGIWSELFNRVCMHDRNLQVAVNPGESDAKQYNALMIALLKRQIDG